MPAFSSTLKMEAVCSSDILVDLNVIRPYYNPEDLALPSPRRGNSTPRYLK
jgi:hypothetical protein